MALNEVNKPTNKNAESNSTTNSFNRVHTGTRVRGALNRNNRGNTLLKELISGIIKFYKEQGKDDVKANIFGNLGVIGFTSNNTLYCTFMIAEDGTGFRTMDVMPKFKQTRDIRFIPQNIANAITSKYNEAKEIIKLDLQESYGSFNRLVPFIISVPNNIELTEEDIIERAVLAYNLPYYASLKDNGEIIEDSLKAIKHKLEQNRKDFQLELYSLTSDSTDLNRIPMRTEWALETIAPEGEGLDSILNPGTPIIASATGFINILPEKYFEPNNPNELLGFSPNIVVNEIETRSMTLGENLLAIASATALIENDNWIKPILSNPEQIKEFNKLAGMKFDKTDNASSVIKRMVNRPIVLSVDFVTHGTSITNANALLAAAAKGDKQAEQDCYNTFNDLTDGEFSKVFAGDQPLFLRAVKLPVGYYKDHKTGVEKALDRIDAASIINTKPKDYMVPLVKYLNTQIDPNMSYFGSLELYDDLGVDAYIVGEKWRCTINPLVVKAMIQALHRCGFRPRLDDPFIVSDAFTLDFTRNAFSSVGFDRGFSALTQSNMNNGFSYTPTYYDPLYPTSK